MAETAASFRNRMGAAQLKLMQARREAKNASVEDAETLQQVVQTAQAEYNALKAEYATRLTKTRKSTAPSVAAYDQQQYIWAWTALERNRRDLSELVPFEDETEINEAYEKLLALLKAKADTCI